MNFLNVKRRLDGRCKSVDRIAGRGADLERDIHDPFTDFAPQCFDAPTVQFVPLRERVFPQGDFWCPTH
jgi:hypothetical protein